jgi:hypothetical protein
MDAERRVLGFYNVYIYNIYYNIAFVNSER